MGSIGIIVIYVVALGTDDVFSCNQATEETAEGTAAVNGFNRNR